MPVIVVPLQSECISRSENDRIQDPSSVRHDKFNCVSLILNSTNILRTLLETRRIVAMTEMNAYFKIIIISNIKGRRAADDCDEVVVGRNPVLPC